MIVSLDNEWTLDLLWLHFQFFTPIEYFDTASFYKILQFWVGNVIPMLKPAEQITNSNDTKLLVVQVRVNVLLITFFGLSAVIAIVAMAHLFVVVQLEIKS